MHRALAPRQPTGTETNVKIVLNAAPTSIQSAQPHLHLP